MSETEHSDFSFRKSKPGKLFDVITDSDHCAVKSPNL